MRHVTMTCPECATPDKAVGHPHADGHQGEWYCFACKKHGSYTITFDTTDSSPSTS